MDIAGVAAASKWPMWHGQGTQSSSQQTQPIALPRVGGLRNALSSGEDGTQFVGLSADPQRLFKKSVKCPGLGT